LTDRKPYWAILEALALPQVLAAFDARIIGTPPLGLDLPTSDIDVICDVRDVEKFTETVRAIFGKETGFAIERRGGPARPVVVNFVREGWPIEIYAVDQPTLEQPGWLHFDVEQRLLALGGKSLKEAVRQRRIDGAKTEPAFADALALKGDPYMALMTLAREDERELVKTLRSAGFR